MKQMKMFLQTAVQLFFFILAVMLLLQSYNIYVRGFRELGRMIEHPSIESREYDE